MILSRIRANATEVVSRPRYSFDLELALVAEYEQCRRVDDFAACKLR